MSDWITGDPPKSDYYLVTWSRSDSVQRYIGIAIYFTGNGWRVSSFPGDYKILAWMPLPDAYEGNESK